MLLNLSMQLLSINITILEVLELLQRILIRNLVIVILDS